MGINEPTKVAVSVADMARMVGLSRARFYELMGSGVFPRPVRQAETGRPFYSEDQQKAVLDVRRRNCGINGQAVLFYARRLPTGPAPARPRRAKPNPTPKVEPISDLLAALRPARRPPVTRAGRRDGGPCRGRGGGSLPERDDRRGRGRGRAGRVPQAQGRGVEQISGGTAMKKQVAVAWAFGVVAVLAAAAPRGGGAGVFGPLEKGSKVTLNETPGGYKIVVMPGVELGHTVAEVGADYVVADAAGVTETRIPVYAVRAVTVTRLPGR